MVCVLIVLAARAKRCSSRNGQHAATQTLPPPPPPPPPPVCPAPAPSFAAPCRRPLSAAPLGAGGPRTALQLQVAAAAPGIFAVPTGLGAAFAAALPAGTPLPPTTMPPQQQLPVPPPATLPPQHHGPDRPPAAKRARLVNVAVMNDRAEAVDTPAEEASKAAGGCLTGWVLRSGCKLGGGCWNLFLNAQGLPYASLLPCASSQLQPKPLTVCLPGVLPAASAAYTAYINEFIRKHEKTAAALAGADAEGTTSNNAAGVLVPAAVLQQCWGRKADYVPQVLLLALKASDPTPLAVPGWWAGHSLLLLIRQGQRRCCLLLLLLLLFGRHWLFLR